MKNSILLTAAILLCALTNAFTQENENSHFVTMINPEGKTAVNFLIDGTFDTDFWDKDYIKIEILVKDNRGEYHITKHLAGEGRFDLMKVADGENLNVFMPNRRKKVTVNGNEYEDELTFKIMLPHYTTLSNWQDTDALVATIRN